MQTELISPISRTPWVGLTPFGTHTFSLSISEKPFFVQGYIHTGICSALMCEVCTRDSSVQVWWGDHQSESGSAEDCQTLAYFGKTAPSARAPSFRRQSREGPCLSSPSSQITYLKMSSYPGNFIITGKGRPSFRSHAVKNEQCKSISFSHLDS